MTQQGSSSWRIRRETPNQAAAHSRPAAKRNQALALVFAILVLIGAIAALIFYLRPAPNPYFIAVWIDEYQDRRLPVNPWSKQDREALLALPWRENSAFTSQERDRLVRVLQDLKEQRKVNEPVVIYLSAFALTGPDGKVSLLPGDARLDDPNTWVPMSNVLKYVQDCPAQHKLLILDVMQPFTDPPSGLLANVVAERLQPDLDAAVAQDANLRVFCPCMPGQVSLSSEDLGHTLFTHYLLQGLYGRADGCLPSQNPKGRVSVQELVEYVTVHVDRWAWMNRKARQTPCFHGSRADFHLLVADPNTKAPEPTPLGVDAGTEPTEAKYPKWLLNGWELRDRWTANSTFRFARPAYLQLESTLLRAEYQWRHGGDPEKEFKGQTARLVQKRDLLAKDVGRSEPESLAAEAKANRPPDLSDGEALQQLKELVDLHVRLQAPKPDDKDKARLKTDTDAFLKKYEGKPFELAWTVFESAVTDTNPRAEQIRFLSGLLLKTKRSPLYRETRLLHDLAKQALVNPRAWPGETVHTALQLVSEAEKSKTAEPAALPWVQGLVVEAVSKRRVGEGLLLNPESASRERAKAPLEEALRLYQTIIQHLQVIQDAQLACDEALVLLPGYGSYLELDPGLEKTWSDAALAAQSLQEVLSQPPGPATAPLTELVGKMGDLTESLRDSLKKLRQPLDPIRLKGLIKQSDKATLSDGLDMYALLEIPWLNAKDRAALWGAWRGVTKRFQQETADLDAGEGATLKLKNAPAPFDSDKAQRQERDRALLRARCSLVLLRLSGATEVGKLDQLLTQASRSPGPATWTAFSHALRQAWVKQRAIPLQEGPN